jgi:hypothetical protein
LNHFENLCLKMKKKRKEKHTHIYINRSGMTKIYFSHSLLLKTMEMSPNITLFDTPGGSARAKHPGGRESDACLCWPRQTQDVKIGSDCSFAKSTTFRSDNHGSFGYAIRNGGPV